MAKTLRILLVEDDAEDALLFQRHCPTGTILRHVVDVEAALIALRQGAIDICFTDYLLGPASGLDLIRAARTEGLRTPMVVITGQEIELLGENALLAGATDFVPKDQLDRACIERVSRWALIRRHVENRRELVLSEDALVQLMGKPPALPLVEGANAADAPALRRLLYISQAERPFLQHELLVVCAGFATANVRTQVTGFLVQAGNCFLQVIEGDHYAIEVLLRRIQTDPRHSHLTVVVDEPVHTREFQQWHMGSFLINVRYTLSPSRWMNLLTGVQRILGREGATRNTLPPLLRALPDLLSNPAELMPKEG